MPMERFRLEQTEILKKSMKSSLKLHHRPYFVKFKDFPFPTASSKAKRTNSSNKNGLYL